MNSAGRRKEKRKNKEEVTRVIRWINSPTCFVPRTIGSENEIIMKKEEIFAFGIRDARTKREWKEFLLRRGVLPDLFKENLSANAKKSHLRIVFRRGEGTRLR